MAWCKEVKVDISFVYTCAICGTICNKEEMHRHPCLDDYPNISIDDNNYFFPTLDDDRRLIRRSFMPDGTEKLVFENVNSSIAVSQKEPDVLISSGSNSKGSKLTDAEVNILIYEVHKRRPLWDVTIPLHQRSREILQVLWNEVSLKLNCKINGLQVKKKFKSLRDTHRRIIQSEQHTRPCTKNDSKEKWKFYEAMEFLRDFTLAPPAETLIIQEAQSESTDTSTDIFKEEDDYTFSLTSDYDSQRKKPRKMNIITNTIDTQESKILPKPDEVQSILHAVGLQLQRMPYQARMQTLMDIMNMVHSRLKKISIPETS